MDSMLLVRQNQLVIVKRFGIIVAGAAAAAGLGFGISTWTGSGSEQSRCGKAVELSPAGRRALDAYAGRIEHDIERFPGGGRHETWSDPVAGRTRDVSFDARGREVSELATLWRRSAEVTTSVDYRTRTWNVGLVQLPAAQTAPIQSAAALSAANRANVRRGVTRVVGRETIDGRTTIHLREVEHARPSLPVGVPKGITLPPSARRSLSLQNDIWVDGLTYVPVRTRATFLGHVVDREQTWLPRIDANIARTKPAVPAGFRQLHQTVGAGFATGVLNGLASPVRCAPS